MSTVCRIVACQEGVRWNMTSNSQNNAIYAVPLRKDNVLVFLVSSAGKFESCFEKRLFMKMKMLMVFLG